MTLDELIAANLVRMGAPPRKPPTVKPVKTGGPGNVPERKPQSASPPPPASPSAPSPETHQRPPYAADIDRMVAEMITRGDVKLDRASGGYRGMGYRCFRFERS